MRDEPLPAIEARIAELTQAKRIFWTADGLRSRPPTEHSDTDGLVLKTPSLDRSGSIERRLAAAIQTSSKATQSLEATPPASVCTVVTPQPPFPPEDNDSAPSVVPSRGDILSRIAQRRTQGDGAKLLHVGRDRPRPAPQLLSAMQGRSPAPDTPVSVSSGSSGTATPHTATPTSSSQKPVVASRSAARQLPQSFMMKSPSQVHVPSTGGSRKFSAAAIDATLNTAVTAVAAVNAPPPFVPSVPGSVPSGEWLTGRVPGRGARSVKRDVVVIDDEDGDFEEPSPFKRGKIDETLIEPVDLFKELSTDQQTVMDLVMAGRNVFFTGSAGTGKSFLLKRLVTALRDKYDTNSVFVTASTGIAACAIDGVTVHSFGGVGLAKEAADVLADKVMKSRNARMRWMEAKVLIIDEVSMIDGGLFDKLELIARTVRRSNKPFGGIQILLSGDFFQLPPVQKQGDRVNFCFQSRSWASVVQASVVLGQVFRQKEATFADVLNDIRVGNVTQEAIALLTPCMVEKLRVSGGSGDKDASRIEHTILFSRNVDVDGINNDRLAKLPGAAKTFTADDRGEESYLKNLNVPMELKLKVDAQVVLLKNLSPDTGLVNGSRGVVIDFKSTEGEEGDMITCPVVRFENGAERVLSPEVWEIEFGGKTVAKRTQVPLRLAWALSIHKSQGMSIDRLKVSLSGVFEFGQAYVALSRATSVKGLILEGFKPELVKAHPDVIEFYNSLKSTVSPISARRRQADRAIVSSPPRFCEGQKLHQPSPACAVSKPSVDSSQGTQATSASRFNDLLDGLTSDDIWS